jgi:TetR/AcrR family transcriptional regulator
VDRIARGAGVNKQLIFYYFGSKAGLFRSVVESTSHDLATSPGPAALPAGPLDRLRTLLEHASRTLEANADLLRATVIGAEAEERARAPLAEQLRQLREAVQAVRALISDAQGLGYVRDDVDPDVVAHLAVTLVVGPVLLPAMGGDGRLRSEIDFLTRGLAW